MTSVGGGGRSVRWRQENTTHAHSTRNAIILPCLDVCRKCTFADKQRAHFSLFIPVSSTKTMKSGEESSSVVDSPLRRVGYWMSEKKSRKFNQTKFTDMCRTAGLELVQLDLTKSLNEQGPFCVILHKLTDVIVKADGIGGNQEEDTTEHQRIVNAFEEYLAANPEILVIDPIDNVRTLIDRVKTYRLIEESPLTKEDGVITPAFVELTTRNTPENLKLLEEAGISFPFICKPSVAHGSRMAHQMAIIFNEDGVKDITLPSVAQAFICHNAILYKLFAIGEKWFLVERPSLKNFYAGNEPTIFFDSHNVSKANSVCSLNQLDEADLLTPLLRPSVAQFHKIMTTIHKNLGMALFGVDVVIENKTGKCAIIDINAFPGYDGVPDINEELISYIVRELDKHNSALPSTRNALILSTTQMGSMDSNQEDSGIETGDSSDEKKNKKPVKMNKRQHQHQRSLSSFGQSVCSNAE